MSRTDVSITTADGVCPAYAFTPDGETGPWPAVIFLMDAPAIRPTFLDMGQRLASSGYYVLVPDMFYRDGPYAPMDPAKLFADEEARKAMFAKMGKGNTPEAARTDMAAFLDFLAGQPEVKGRKVGVTGYCMGGRLALMAAISFPDRVAAAGAFHTGRLVTDDPESIHRNVSKMKARVYIGSADQDAGFPPEDKDTLDAAFTAAGVDHRVEIYDGAKHGYTMKDLSVYDEAAAERHWRETVQLFDAALKSA